MNFIFDVKYLSDKPGIADMEINIEIPQGILAVIRWADEGNRRLEDYTDIKAIQLIDGKATYRLEGNVLIPPEASKIICHVYNDSMIEILLPELIKDIPEEKRFDPGEPKERYIFTSDVHLGGNYFNNSYNRRCLFDLSNTFHPEFILVSGDITDNCNPEEFEEGKTLFERLKNKPVLASVGNHDLAPYKPGCYPHYEEMTEFFNWQRERAIKYGATVGELHLPRYYYDARISGIHVIILDACNENNKFYLGEEQLKWLDETLCKSDGERYRIVVSHFHQAGTVVQDPKHKNFKYYKDNDEVQAILDKHKNIIHTSGHTHFNFDTDYRNTYYDAENNNLYLNAGCAVWNGVSMEERREYYLQDRSTAQIIEVYDDFIITRSANFNPGKYASRCIHMINI